MGWAGDARPWRDKRDDHGGDVADAARFCLHPVLAATDIRHDESAVRHRAEAMSRQTRTWVVVYTWRGEHRALRRCREAHTAQRTLTKMGGPHATLARTDRRSR